VRARAHTTAPTWRPQPCKRKTPRQQRSADLVLVQADTDRRREQSPEAQFTAHDSSDLFAHHGAGRSILRRKRSSAVQRIKRHVGPARRKRRATRGGSKAVKGLNPMSAVGIVKLQHLLRSCGGPGPTVGPGVDAMVSAIDADAMSGSAGAEKLSCNLRERSPTRPRARRCG